MIAFIKNWIADGKHSRDVQQYDRGYDFAAGMLIRSLGTSDPRDHIDSLDYKVSPFDVGVHDATAHFQAMTRMVVRSR